MAYQTIKKVLGGAVIAGLALLGTVAHADKLKVAGIYTQPIQQKWDAALHKGLVAAQAAGEIRVCVLRKGS